MIDGLLFVLALVNFAIMVAAAQNPLHPAALRVRDGCAIFGIVILATVTYRIIYV